MINRFIIKLPLQILFFYLVFLFFPPFAKAAYLAIEGNPLEIRGDEYGGINFFRWQSGSLQKQYYEPFGTFLFLNGTATSFDSLDSGSLGYTGKTRFTASRHVKVDDWTLETTFLAGATGVQIARTISYANGSNYYTANYKISNTGSTTYTDVRFLYGGDTFFAGNDSSYGYWDSSLKMVYLFHTDATQTGLMGLFGEEASADNYYETTYSSVWTQLAAGTLPNTVNADFHDAGYGLQWNKSSLAPGEDWTIKVYEKVTGAGKVQVVAPADRNLEKGNTSTYQFTVMNRQASQDTFDLQLSSSKNWTTSLPNGSSVTIGANTITSVTATISVPTNISSGTIDTLTLTATSQSDNSITNSDAVKTTSSDQIASAESPISLPLGCNDQSPGIKPPWLYSAIPQGSDSIMLYFADADGPLDKYVLTFGTKSGDYQYGALNIGGETARAYLVNYLAKNTEYFFKIRAGNGCATGPWSNEISAKTWP